MADPKIKYDIEAETKGGAEVDALAKSLEDLGSTLDGELKAGADIAAAALRELGAKSEAAQAFALLKREAADLGLALSKASANVEGIAAQMPIAAASAQQFADAERRARDAVDDAQQGIKSMQQSLVDLRSSNEGAARGTDEYKASVAQARSTIAELRTTLVQKKADLKEAVAGTREAAIAEKELEDKYKLSVNTAKSLSASYGDKNRALNDARTAAQALGVDTTKLRQEEQALAQGMAAGTEQLKLLVEQQEAASAATRERAEEEQKLAGVVESTRKRMEAAARAEADGILRDAALVEEANKRAKAAADEVAAASAAAGQRIKDAFSTLGARSAADLRAEIAQVRAAMQTVEVESGLTGAALKQAMGAGNAKLRELQRELKGVQGELTLADRASDLLRTGLGRIAAGNVIANAIGNIASRAGEMGREFLKANLQMEGLRRALNSVYKDANVTATQIDFLRKTASDAGISAGGLSDSFKSFAASTHAANIPLQTTNELFAGVARAGGVLGLSGERVSLVLQALGQMASKGVVSMEELRQQLGESLPGALTLAAKGMGLTEAQLIKLVESGGLAARDLFPALAKSLQQIKGETDGVTSSWERFKNALTLASQNAGDAGGMQLLTLSIKALGVVVGLVVLPLAAFAEVIFGVAKAVGVVAGSIATLTSPFKALGAIVDDASKRQSALTAAFGGLVNGADSASSSQVAAGAAIAQAGREAGSAAVGVGSIAQAHGAAAGAAQANAAAQDAAAVAVRIAGNAGADAGAKWVQLGVQLRDIAAAQDQQAKNATKLAAAAKIEGDGLQALAALRGNELESLRAASAASEAHAFALQRVAVAREAQLSTLRAELDAKRALIVGNAEEQKARAIELQEIEKKIDALDAEATATRAAAEAAKTDAAVRRAAVGAYQDNAHAVGELSAALEQARIVQEAFESDRRKGLATDEQVDAAKRRAAEAQRLYNDALDDAVAAEQRRGAATQSRLQIERAGLDLAMAQAKAAEQKAVADGNEYAATQARIKQKEIEVAAIKLAVAAMIAEAEAMDLVTNKKIEAAIAQGKWTEAMGAEMQLLRESAELKRAQAAATKESIAELERELKNLRENTSAHKDNSAARHANVSATSAQSDAMEKLLMQYTLSADYTERQIKLLEREAAAAEKAAEAYRKKWNMDKEGYSLNSAGDRVMAGESQDKIDKDIAERYGAANVGNPDAQRARQLRALGQLRSKGNGLVTQRDFSADERRELQELESRLLNGDASKPAAAPGRAESAGKAATTSQSPPATVVTINLEGRSRSITTDAAGASVLQDLLGQLAIGRSTAGR